MLHTLHMIQEEAQDFRLYLQNKLTERCKKNPKYYLRSFAQRLDMESSALSKILRGKRRVTEKTFLKLSKILNLSPHEIAQFRQNLKQSAEYDYSPKNYQQVSLDAFNVISDWYHYAILELTTVKKFKPSEKWIAKSLGISVSEVNIAWTVRKSDSCSSAALSTYVALNSASTPGSAR